jgi:hypothetical protein
MLSLTEIGQAESSFSFRVAGGFGMIPAGDLGTVIDSYNTMLDDFKSSLGMTRAGDLEKIRLTYHIEGEVIMSITKKFGIGIAAGYLQGKTKSQTVLKYDSLLSLETRLEPKYSFIPLKLNAYYFFETSSKLKFFLSGGIGYYLGAFSYSMKQDENVMGTSNMAQASGKVRNNCLGFQGGLGLEYDFTDTIAVFLEGRGRSVQLRNWEGDEMYSDSEGIKESRKGTLWYYENRDEASGKYYSTLDLSEIEPEGFSKRNIKKFEVNLSGFSLNVGLRFKF